MLVLSRKMTEVSESDLAFLTLVSREEENVLVVLEPMDLVPWLLCN